MPPPLLLLMLLLSLSNSFLVSSSPRSPLLRSLASSLRAGGGDAPPDAPPTEPAALAGLRLAMARHSPPVDAYIVPSDDQHLSEYTHPHYQRRQHLTGFSGSAGTALVTPQGAKLWTDSRYYEQAEKELPEGVGLMRSGLPGTPTIAKYLEKYLESEGEPLRVGIDPELHSSSFVKALEKALPLPPVFTKGNLLDESWAERPPPPTSQVS